MKLIVDLKLLPSREQAAALLDTLQRANQTANDLSRLAWEHKTFRQYDLHKLAYHPIKDASGLTSQILVRLIAKVADAYKLDRDTPRTFRPLGSIAYDDRILRYKADSVSIWTTDGRATIPFVCGKRQRALLATRQGESDLVYRDGSWYLFAIVNVDEPPTGPVDDFLGVDLGIVSIATTSDGATFAGGVVNGLRRRNRRLRQKLQRKGTHATRRLLVRRRLKEARFCRQVNHTISKRLVAVAERTMRGIAVERLKGIRSRVRARRSQRATLHSWSFDQLGSFLSDKCRLAGVPLVQVDPRNTSRTCPACGDVDKANRRSQSAFLCRQCFLAGNADHFAALILRDRGRAAVTRPYFPTPAA
jgi:putative transposase